MNILTGWRDVLWSQLSSVKEIIRISTDLRIMYLIIYTRGEYNCLPRYRRFLSYHPALSVTQMGVVIIEKVNLTIFLIMVQWKIAFSMACQGDTVSFIVNVQFTIQTSIIHMFRGLLYRKRGRKLRSLSTKVVFNVSYHSESFLGHSGLFQKVVKDSWTLTNVECSALVAGYR